MGALLMLKRLFPESPYKDVTFLPKSFFQPLGFYQEYEALPYLLSPSEEQPPHKNSNNSHSDSSGSPPGNKEDFKKAFEKILAQYERRIFNLIYRFVGNYEDASDLTQETFINAFRAFPRFRGEAPIFIWLCRIAINTCRNLHRQKERLKPFQGPSLDTGSEGDEEVFFPEPGDRTFQPDLVLERAELRRVIENAIQSLPSDYRLVIILRDLQELSYQEIAEITGLSLEAVKTRIHRGRKMLRKMIEPYLRG